MHWRILAGDGDEGLMEHREESGGLTSPWAVHESVEDIAKVLVVFVGLVFGGCEHDMIERGGKDMDVHYRQRGLWASVWRM